MKCPKCGYNSFEFLDTCKKCNADLSTIRQTLGFRTSGAPRAAQPAAPSPEPAAVMAPAGQAEPPVTEIVEEPVAESAKGQPSGDFDFHFEEPKAGQKEPESFSFDELHTPAELPPTREETPQKPEEFSFEEFTFTTAGAETSPQPGAEPVAGGKNSLEGFEWEGTSLEEKSPAETADKPAAAQTEPFSTSGPPEEFDLSAFSFEEPETPKPQKKPAVPEGEKSTIHSDFNEEEFKSLFEEASEEK